MLLYMQDFIKRSKILMYMWRRNKIRSWIFSKGGIMWIKGLDQGNETKVKAQVNSKGKNNDSTNLEYMKDVLRANLNEGISNMVDSDQRSNLGRLMEEYRPKQPRTILDRLIRGGSTKCWSTTLLRNRSILRVLPIILILLYFWYFSYFSTFPLCYLKYR